MKKIVFNAETIRLREFELKDIDPLCDYWYRSPPGFLESMGVVPQLMDPEATMRKIYKDSLRKNLPDTELERCQIVIEYKGDAIGIHGLGNIKYGEEEIFHAHIWKPEFRRKGLGSYTYPRACKYFMDRFNLKKIYFKTPILNPGPNSVKQKLGLKPIAETIVTAPFLQPDLKAYLYELYPEQLDNLLK